MIDNQTPDLETAGELVLLNGGQRGTSVPIKLPMTMIGSGPACDVRIVGPGMVETHCIIAMTATGLSLRAWAETFVNDEAVTTATLQQNDEVSVGPCRMRIILADGEFVELKTLPESDTIHEDPREKAISDTVGFYQNHLASLLGDLSDRRELLRQDQEADAPRRDALEEREAEIERLHDAAKGEYERSRSNAATLLLSTRKELQEERNQLQAGFDQLRHERAKLERDQQQDEIARVRFSADAEAYRNRLQEAWKLLNEAQRRLIADRQQIDATHARERHVLDERHSELTQQARTLTDAQSRVEERVSELLAEIARLEVRASHARTILQALESQREEAESNRVIESIHLSNNGVSLIRSSPQDANRLLLELGEREQELARERAKLARARTELERHAADLIDQRSVVAEQIDSIASVRHLWQVAECDTIAEIEGLARDLAHRETAMNERVRTLEFAERRANERQEEQRDQYRKLEGWQLALQARETQTITDREQSLVEIEQQRYRLTHRDEALTTLYHKWASLRKHEVTQLRETIESWNSARIQCRATQANADAERRKNAEDAAKLATLAMSLEQAEQEWSGAADTVASQRRMKVIRSAWDRHFQRFINELDQRGNDLDIEIGTIDQQYRNLTQLAQEVTIREKGVATTMLQHDLKQRSTTAEVQEKSSVLVTRIDSGSILEQVEATAANLMRHEERIALTPASSSDDFAPLATHANN